MKAAKDFCIHLEEMGRITDTKQILVTLFGSLSLTGVGHGTDKAVLVGLEGNEPDDFEPIEVERTYQRVLDSEQLCLLGDYTIRFKISEDLRFENEEVKEFHSNAIEFVALDHWGEKIASEVYYSVGGGFVQAHRLLDKLSDDELQPKFLFDSFAELHHLTDLHGLTIPQIVMENELQYRDADAVHRGIVNLWKVMQDAVYRGCHHEGLLPGVLKLPRRAKKLYQSLIKKHEIHEKDTITTMDWISLFAIATCEENAAGGRIVTAPTNGAAGILPAVLHYYQKFVPTYSIRGVYEFFLTTSAIAWLYKKRASISGAEAGCQGEVGVASSMAAAGLAAVLGGKTWQIEMAAEIAMEHHLGLPCDPVAGLVQIPCIERNSMGAIKAINAARLAMRSDVPGRVRLDEVMDAMNEITSDMHMKYKETSLGGLAKAVRSDEKLIQLGTAAC